MPTRAFHPYGTKVSVAGRDLPEVVAIDLVKEGFSIECNFLPDSEAQQMIVTSIQDESYRDVTITLPMGTRVRVYGRLTGDTRIHVQEVARIKFVANGEIQFLAGERAA